MTGLGSYFPAVRWCMVVILMPGRWSFSMWSTYYLQMSLQIGTLVGSRTDWMWDRNECKLPKVYLCLKARDEDLWEQHMGSVTLIVAYQSHEDQWTGSDFFADATWGCLQHSCLLGSWQSKVCISQTCVLHSQRSDIILSWSRNNTYLAIFEVLDWWMMVVGRKDVAENFTDAIKNTTKESIIDDHIPWCCICLDTELCALLMYFLYILYDFCTFFRTCVHYKKIFLTCDIFEVPWSTNDRPTIVAVWHVTFPPKPWSLL